MTCLHYLLSPRYNIGGRTILDLFKLELRYILFATLTSEAKAN